ncbi:MAG: ABC transporter substrate-binding protein [Flavobacteriales bacterium]
MKVWFYCILTIVLIASCSAPVTEKTQGTVSLTKYAVGFRLYDRVDSIELSIDGQHFTFAKATKNNFIISSSTQLTFLKELGELKNIIGLIDANIFLDTALHKEKLLDFKSAAAPDWEALFKYNKSIVLGYKHFSLHKGSANHMDLTVVPVNEYLEEHPLGKAEWIKVLGALSGKYEQADSLFTLIEQRYNAVKATAKPNGAKVIAGEYYRDSWSVPGSASYVALMVKDAGGEYLVKNSESTLPMNREAFAVLLKEAVYWRKLTPMDWRATELTRAEVQVQFDVYPTQLKGILYCDVNQNAYFENALLHPDLELEDMISALNGGEGKHFYRVIKVD